MIHIFCMVLLTALPYESFANEVKNTNAKDAVEIVADRNRSSDDLSFAVSALANMGQYAKKPFKKYVVTMHYNVRGKSSDICNANARCTADYMIRKQVTYDHWYKKCITFETN